MGPSARGPVAALALLLAAACKPAATAPPPRDAVADARALAMLAPEGTPQLDAELVSLQARVQRGPDSAVAWVELGRAWIRKARASGDPGYYLSADAAARIALRCEPDHRPALGLRTLVLLNQHAFAEARAQAQAMLAHDPDDLVALAALSDAALELGRIEEAVAAAQHLVDLKPNLAAYGRAAHLRWLLGDGPGAKQAYRAAIESGRGARDPEPRAWMLVQAAMVFWQEGDAAGAELGFDQALGLLPGYAPALAGKARARLSRGDPGGAVPLLEEALERQPLAETAWLLGDARAGAGDARGAEEAYARVVRLGRQSDPLTLGLFLATRNQDIPEALALLAAEHRARPGVAVEDAYAWALCRARRLDEARAASDRALAHGTLDARLVFHAGAIRLAQGERDAGLALVKRALALNPRFDAAGAEEAGALLQELGPRHAAR